MDIPEFASVDTLRRLWWLHDSFWHAALVKELGFEQANRINLEVASPSTLYQNLIEGMSLPLFNIELRIAGSRSGKSDRKALPHDDQPAFMRSPPTLYNDDPLNLLRTSCRKAAKSD